MFCSNCGKEIQESDKYCSFCGNMCKQENSTISKKIKGENQNKVKKFIRWGGIVILLIMFVALNAMKNNVQNVDKSGEHQNDLQTENPAALIESSSNLGVTDMLTGEKRIESLLASGKEFKNNFCLEDAFVCYKEILEKDPDNIEAIEELRSLSNLFVIKYTNYGRSQELENILEYVCTYVDDNNLKNILERTKYENEKLKHPIKDKIKYKSNLDTYERWTYDQHNGLLSEESEDLTAKFAYTYDENGNKTSVKYLEYNGIIYTKDNEIVYEYDEHGNCVSEKYENSEDVSSGYCYTSTFTYDEFGNLLTAKHEFDPWTYTYDKLGNITKMEILSELVWLPSDYEYINEYAFMYDDDFHIKEIHSSEGVAEAQYDENGYLTCIQYQNGKLFSVQYPGESSLAYGLQSEIWLPKGEYMAVKPYYYEYDEKGNILNEHHMFTDSTVLHQVKSYEYDGYNLIREYDPYNAHIIESEYDEHNNVIKETVYYAHIVDFWNPEKGEELNTVSYTYWD